MTDQNGFRDFESMSEKQRQDHYYAVCAAAGLDPALNLLKWTRMDSGDGTGAKRLVLYATKGATNAIREIQGIDVTGLTDKTVGGAFVVTATAKNKKGRTDIAMGAASLEGKRGKALENAFALAQTRATRRVTLQMSGLDLLDESEVMSDGTTPIAEAPMPLDQIGTPVEVNSDAGTDITAAGLTLKGFSVNQVLVTDNSVPETPERLPNPAAGLKLATVNLGGPSGASRAAATQRPTASSEVTTADVPPPTGTSVSNQTQEAPKQRRKRRTKAEMEAAAGNAVTARVEAGLPAESPSEQAQAELEPLPDKQPVKASISTELPTPDQMKVYVEKLTKYRTEILPAGGMVPSHGMGINKKIRSFFSVANNNTEDLTKLTVAQWDATFNYMDSVLAQKGAKELVAIIETNIGAFDEARV
jgi:hypothetical protein